MATLKFLDYTGLGTLVAKIKAAISDAIKSNVTDKLGAASGIATLGSDGKLTASQLPDGDTSGSSGSGTTSAPSTDFLELAEIVSGVSALIYPKASDVKGTDGGFAYDDTNKRILRRWIVESFNQSTGQTSQITTYDYWADGSTDTTAEGVFSGYCSQGGTPLTGKLYVNAADNKIYRWNGTDMVEVSGSMSSDSDVSGVRADLSALEADIAELQDAVWPMSVSLTVSPTVIQAGSAATLTATADVTRKGSSVFSDATVTLNGSAITAKSNSVAVAQSSATGGTTLTQTVSATYQGTTKSTSKTVSVVFPSYFGTVASDWTATADNAKGLTASLQTSRALTKTGLSLSNGRIAYAYPKSFGALSSVKDGNNFEVLGSYTLTEVSITQADGTSTTAVAYYVYLLTDPVTADGVKQVYS